MSALVRPRPPDVHTNLKWPRSLEDDPRLPELEALMQRERVRLWDQGTIEVAGLVANPELEKILMTLQGRQQLERGLERISEILANEKKGLVALQQKQGSAPAQRISRLLIVAGGGSERFMRGCERLLIEHGERLLGVCVDMSEAQTIERLYGPDSLAKVLLISHRDAVAETLWALLGDTPDAEL